MTSQNTDYDVLPFVASTRGSQPPPCRYTNDIPTTYFNPLKLVTGIKIQSVPRSEHTPSRL
jgi:hypothetical protein